MNKYENPVQRNERNIVLIGLRGSGKTTVGEILGVTMDRAFIDTDKLLVKRQGISIPQIVENHGWDYFRDLESDLALELSERKKAVIATGGGIVLRAKNVEALQAHGWMAYLSASPAVLASRIEGDSNRPRLTNEESLEQELARLAQDREALYQNAADSIFFTEGFPPRYVAGHIRHAFLVDPRPALPVPAQE